MTPMELPDATGKAPFTRIRSRLRAHTLLGIILDSSDLIAMSIALDGSPFSSPTAPVTPGYLSHRIAACPQRSVSGSCVAGLAE